MPLYLSGWQTDGSSWTTSVTDDVITLYLSEDIARFVEELLVKDTAASQPYAYADRIQRIFANAPTFDAIPPATKAFDNAVISATSDQWTFVDLKRLTEMRTINNAKFDCTRLICLCEELNDSASRQNAHAVIMLIRTILNHVPPIFGFRTFAEVANHYSCGFSLKHVLRRLEDVSRRIADRLSHMPIERREVTPNMTQVNFSNELDVMLSELCRLLK
jgi:hypothetical protein